MLISQFGVHFRGLAWNDDNTALSLDLDGGSVLGVGVNCNGKFIVKGTWDGGVENIPTDVTLNARNSNGDWPLNLFWNGRALLGVTKEPANKGGDSISVSLRLTSSGPGTLRFTGRAWGDSTTTFAIHIEPDGGVIGIGTSKQIGDFSISGSWPGSFSNKRCQVNLVFTNPEGDWPMQLSWNGRALFGTATESSGEHVDVSFSCGVAIDDAEAERRPSEDKKSPKKPPPVSRSVSRRSSRSSRDSVGASDDSRKGLAKKLPHAASPSPRRFGSRSFDSASFPLPPSSASSGDALPQVVEARKAADEAKGFATDASTWASSAQEWEGKLEARVAEFEKLVERHRARRRRERAEDGVKDVEKVSDARAAEAAKRLAAWEAAVRASAKRTRELEAKMAELDAWRKLLAEEAPSTLAELPPEKKEEFEAEDARVQSRKQEETVSLLHAERQEAMQRELERLRVEMATTRAELDLAQAHAEEGRLEAERAKEEAQEARKLAEATEAELKELQLKELQLKRKGSSGSGSGSQEADLVEEREVLEEIARVKAKLEEHEEAALAKEGEAAVAKKKFEGLLARVDVLRDKLERVDPEAMERLTELFEAGDAAQREVAKIQTESAVKAYYLSVLTNLKAFFTACEAVQSKMVDRHEQSLSENVKASVKAGNQEGLSGFWKSLDKKKVMSGVVDFASDALSGIPCARTAGSVLKVMLGTVVSGNQGPALGLGAEFMALAAAQQVGRLDGGSEAVLERAARELAMKRWDFLLSETKKIEESTNGSSGSKKRSGGGGDPSAALMSLFCGMVSASGLPDVFSVEGASDAATGVALFGALVGSRSSTPPAEVAALADTSAITQAILAGRVDPAAGSLEKNVVSFVFPPPPAQEQSKQADGEAEAKSAEASGSPSVATRSSRELTSDIKAATKQLEATQRDQLATKKELEHTKSKLSTAEKDLAELKLAVDGLLKQSRGKSAAASVRGKIFDRSD